MSNSSWNRGVRFLGLTFALLLGGCALSPSGVTSASLQNDNSTLSLSDEELVNQQVQQFHGDQLSSTSIPLDHPTDAMDGTAGTPTAMDIQTAYPDEPQKDDWTADGFGSPEGSRLAQGGFQQPTAPNPAIGANGFEAGTVSAPPSGNTGRQLGSGSSAPRLQGNGMGLPGQSPRGQYEQVPGMRGPSRNGLSGPLVVPRVVIGDTNRIGPGVGAFSPQSGATYSQMTPPATGFDPNTAQPSTAPFVQGVTPVRQQPSDADLVMRVPPAPGSPLESHVPGKVHMYGDELRAPGTTATDAAIFAYEKIDLLRHELATLKQKMKQLEDVHEAERKAHADTRKKLDGAQQMNSEYKQLVAQSGVEIEQLKREKEEIKQRADRALRDIEARLETMLMSTISNTVGDGR